MSLATVTHSTLPLGRRIAGALAFPMALLCQAMPAAAQDAQLHGYLDLRLVRAPEERSFIEGGHGRLRYGGEGHGLEFGGAALVGRAQLGPAWVAVGTLQVQERDETDVDVVEAYLRWRPVSSIRMSRRAARAGRTRRGSRPSR